MVRGLEDVKYVVLDVSGLDSEYCGGVRRLNGSIWVYMSPKAYTAHTSGPPDFSIAASTC